MIAINSLQMKVHVISESLFLVKGTGIHTAFLNHLDLLREKDDVEVVVNGEGTGDIFHSHTYFLYYFWKGRNYKGRRVFTVHVIPESLKGSFPAWWLLMPFVKWGLRKVYSYADVCIAISPAVENAIIRSGAETRIVRIPNPIDTEFWQRDPAKRRKGRELLGINEKDFVVIGVGQIQGRKGVEDFLEIAESIDGAKFVWAGGRPFKFFTEGIVRINRKFREAGNRVISPGEIDISQMPFIYAAADLMLFPSLQENCPLAPLEAAASSIPVIFRDLEEYRLLYENPYLKAKNKDEFIQLTRKMMTDSDFYDEGVRISARLLKQFDKETIREQLISLYNSLL
jgi:1,2-diacylglycerol-3-alpha-glucose alpha-1,2-galactosyltransferase